MNCKRHWEHLEAVVAGVGVVCLMYVPRGRGAGAIGVDGLDTYTCCPLPQFLVAIASGRMMLLLFKIVVGSYSSS